MSRITLAEAQARLPELVSRAAAGEEVVIEQEGGPAVVLRVSDEPFPGLGPVDPEKLAWLESLLVRPSKPSTEHAGEYVSRSRDEDWR